MPTGVTIVPLLDLKAQFEPIEDEVRAAIDGVLKSQRFILGPEVQGLETEIAEYCQCSSAVGVSSGTDALLIALMALGIKAGDEVITTPYTFFATAGSIARLGAKPVFVDVDPLTYNIVPEQIEAVVTDKTRAIIPVHLYGQTADMDPIIQIARRGNLFVIEDAAQAIGAEYKGRRAGSIGQLGCFSFFPSKNLGALGDGGMVTTNQPDLADRLTLLRNHGYRPKYYNKVVGGNFRLDALQAAVLRVKLKYLDKWTQGRRDNADTYRRLFDEAGLAADPINDYQQLNPRTVVLPGTHADCRHVYNQFVIRVHHDLRPKLIEHLKQRRIGCEIYYPHPIHLQECFADLGYNSGDLPASELAARQTLALPIYPELTDTQQATVVNAVGEFLSQC